jgi:hypothetical protein
MHLSQIIGPVVDIMSVTELGSKLGTALTIYDAVTIGSLVSSPLFSGFLIAIHLAVPSFIDLDTNLAIFETGIKVVDRSTFSVSKGPSLVSNLPNCWFSATFCSSMTISQIW